MLLGFALFKRDKVERLRLSTLLATDQSFADALNLEALFLFALDEVADRLAVGGVAPAAAGLASGFQCPYPSSGFQLPRSSFSGF